MKMQSLKLFVAALIISFISVGSAFAQQSLDFEIPFDFQIGKKEMQAGKYKIKKIDGKQFIFKNVETNKSRIIMTDAQIGDERSVTTENLVFNRYGDTYFLREIYAARSTVGREFGESKLEKKLRKEFKNNDSKLAKNKFKPEQVSIKTAQ